MSANDRVLINQMIDEWRNARSVPLSFDAAFERFASEHALHGFGLSEEEIEAGIIGGGNDGGIDGAYVFLAAGCCTRTARSSRTRRPLPRWRPARS
ncbi:hypothetical protein [Streptomyces sp. NPDC002463]|uniref:hypothetical protein n=1 Tax=Streptomyces sp. NPDC002463 TaxID=3364645 RepID=UPI0036893FE5